MTAEPRPVLLIIDDDPSVLSALNRLYRREPYDVVAAADGRSALQTILEREISVVICDENMPGVRGSELLRRLRDRWPDTVRIMLTGSVDIDVAVRAINDGGAHYFIRKPWNDDEMLIVTRQAFEKHHLLFENRRLTAEIKKQQDWISSLEEQYPGITKLRTDDHGYYIPSNE